MPQSRNFRIAIPSEHTSIPLLHPAKKLSETAFQESQYSLISLIPRLNADATSQEQRTDRRMAGGD